MASRTPKHMPRCSARIIFMLKLLILCYHKVNDRTRSVSFKLFSLFTLGLLEDLLQQVDVVAESLLARLG